MSQFPEVHVWTTERGLPTRVELVTVRGERIDVSNFVGKVTATADANGHPVVQLEGIGRPVFHADV